MHHLKHNKVLHEQVVLMTVSILDVPTVERGEPIEVQPLAHGFYRVVARFGFMERPDVPTALARAACSRGLQLQRRRTRPIYLAHLTLLATDRIGMSAWRDKLFIFLSRNARRATSFFQIPPDRVVEIGIQLRDCDGGSLRYVVSSFGLPTAAFP